GSKLAHVGMKALDVATALQTPATIARDAVQIGNTYNDVTKALQTGDPNDQAKALASVGSTTLKVAQDTVNTVSAAKSVIETGTKLAESAAKVAAPIAENAVKMAAKAAPIVEDAAKLAAKAAPVVTSIAKVA